MHWKKRPKRVHELGPEVDHVLFIDESGTSEMKNIKKKINKGEEILDEDRFFCVTGVLIHKDEISKIARDITELKYKHWPPFGMADYKGIEKRVCFHSYEIRNRKNVFSPKFLNDYNGFMADLSEFLKSINVKVFSILIDKKELYERYRENHQHPYDLSMEFILERLSFCTGSKGNCAIVLEGRGKDPDRNLLKHIVKVIENGTYYVDSSKFDFISGVYFNLKWSEYYNDKKSFFGLEIADLFCHPLKQFGVTNKESLPYSTIKPKIYGFPRLYGRGFKKFPRK